MSEGRISGADRADSAIPTALISSPREFVAVAEKLAAGQGPFAIDTERASAYRYDDRAFVVQVRRAGAGTFLLDPEGRRAEFTAAFAPVLNGADWIIHAAPSDLPCLAELGLYPGSIFDTELAARLAGYDHPNLATMVETLVGVHLDKGFGDADWSQRPLTKDLLRYAAQDVTELLELAEVLRDILAETDKAEWARQEFETMRAEFAAIDGLPQHTWRDLRGVSTLRTREQLAAAKALWEHRDQVARSRDLAPGKLLPNKALIEVARVLPKNLSALGAVRGFPRRRAGATTEWFAVIERSQLADPATFPELECSYGPFPSKTTMSREFPDLWDLYQDIRADLADLAEEMSVNEDVLISTTSVREAVWAALAPEMVSPDLAPADAPVLPLHDPNDVPKFLLARGVRPWQVTLVSPVIIAHLFAH